MRGRRREAASPSKEHAVATVLNHISKGRVQGFGCCEEH